MRRGLAAGIAILAAVVIVGVWAVPTFVGGAFVSVRAIVVAVPDAAPSGVTVSLADGSTHDAGRLRIEIEITNSYPLTVTLGFRGPAYTAALRPVGAAGSDTAWAASADDRALEQVDDSPDVGGAGSTRVVAVDPGSRVVTFTPTDPTGALANGLVGAAAGSYTLSVSAYGVSAPTQLLGIDRPPSAAAIP